MGRKFLGFCNQGHSSSSSSTSQRESFPGAGRQCGSANSFRSPRQLKSYTACGKIYKAACRGDDATVMSRLKFGKNGINEPDKNNRTILHYACAHGHLDVVFILMELSCDIDLRDSDNSTALIKASQYEHEECMAILLRHGADPNAADNRGNTALHYVVWSNNASMAKILLAHGANISIRNKDGISPLILALTENNKDLAKILVNQRSKLKEVDELDRKSIGSNACGFSHSFKEYEDKYQRVLQLLIEDARTEEMQDQLQRLEIENPKLKNKTEHHIEETEQLQPTLLDTSSVTENAMKHKANTVHESKTQNYSTASPVQQRQDGKAEEPQTPVEESQVHDGSIEKSSNVKNKVKEPVNHMFDPAELSPPLERKAEDSEVFGFDSLLALTECLKRQREDLTILPIVWNSIDSYKRSVELQNHNFELLCEKTKTMENHVSLLQKKLLESKETKLQPEFVKPQQPGEMSNLRTIHENSSLINTVRQKAENTEQLQRNSSENTEDKLKKYTEVNHTLKYRLEEGMKKINKHENKLTRVKNIFKMREKKLLEQGKREIDHVTANLYQELLSCEQLKKKEQSKCQKHVSWTAARVKCRILEESNKKLRQEVFTLKNHMEKNLIDNTEAEIYKQETKRRSKQQLEENFNGTSLFLKIQSEARNKLEKSKVKHLASVRIEMECRLKETEATISIQKSQNESDRLDLQSYKRCSEERRNLNMLLSQEINKEAELSTRK